MAFFFSFFTKAFGALKVSGIACRALLTWNVLLWKFIEKFLGPLFLCPFEVPFHAENTKLYYEVLEATGYYFLLKNNVSKVRLYIFLIKRKCRRRLALPVIVS